MYHDLAISLSIECLGYESSVSTFDVDECLMSVAWGVTLLTDGLSRSMSVLRLDLIGILHCVYSDQNKVVFFDLHHCRI